MRLPVAEDRNCFTTRLKYRLEPKKLAQLRFDTWREYEEPYQMQRSVITSINSFYLIYHTGIIPYPPPIWFAKSKLRPDQIAYIEELKLNLQKLHTVNADAHKDNDLSDESFKEQLKDLVDQIGNELQEIEKLFKEMESFDLDDMTKKLEYIREHSQETNGNENH